MPRKKLLLAMLVLSLAGSGVGLEAYQTHERRFSAWVDASGNIVLPTGLRAGWAHLGSWAVRGDDDSLSFHDVYTEPESLDYFNEHGSFPDGATLVKEVRSSESATMTTGRASWASQPQIWFVMVKDNEERFRGNPLWGDGWGWALFDAKEPSAAVTESYTSECKACHVPARETDWVYVQGYPALVTRSSVETPMTTARSTTMMSSASTGDANEDLPSDVVVNIKGLAFTPREIRVRKGSTITWVNLDDVPHTATADDGGFDTGVLAAGETASIVLDTPGSYPYHCTPHPFMKALVIVE